MTTTFAVMPLDGEYQLANVIFALAFTICEISIFKTFDSENLGHCHMVEKRDLPFDWEYHPA